MTYVTAKKSLGQHFLRSQVALTQIVKAGKLALTDTVLEIGPGEGALTEALLRAGVRVVAVETDERCVAILNERFAEEKKDGRFVLITGDIRNDDIQKTIFLKEHLGTAPYKLIANIPYYITGMLFRLFLEHLRQPSLIIFLIQKEVANEIIARDGKEGILSLAVKAYGDPRVVAKVKREAFSPPPKVDSAIIAIENISHDRLDGLSNESYFRVVKAGLGSRRKMLLGNLARGLNIPKETIEAIFSTLQIPLTIRGEDVSIEQWIKLAQTIAKRVNQKPTDSRNN